MELLLFAVALNILYSSGFRVYKVQLLQTFGIAWSTSTKSTPTNDR